MFTPIVVRVRTVTGLRAAVRTERWRYVFAGVASAGAYALVLIAALLLLVAEIVLINTRLRKVP